jgi:hypothetical protein
VGADVDGATIDLKSIIGGRSTLIREMTKCAERQSALAGESSISNKRLTTGR